MIALLALLTLAQDSRPDVGFFGASVIALDDLDGDGTPDFAVGAPRYGINYPGPTGCVFVYSGASGQEIASWQPTPDARARGEGHSFGKQLTPAGDLDGDGTRDVLIAGQGPVGTFAWSAKAGVRLFGLDVEPSDAQVLGDLNRDGCADVLVTRPSGWSVVSGRGGATLAEVADPPAERALLLRDGNGDGLADGVSVDGELLLTTERTEEKGLRFVAAPSGLVEGRRFPSRVEIAHAPGGTRQLFTLEAMGLRARIHGLAATGLEPLAELEFERGTLNDQFTELQALALPHGDGYDLVAAMLLQKNPFEIYVQRHRPAAADPAWTRSLFYPSRSRIALAGLGGPAGAPRLIVGLRETCRDGACWGRGAVYVLDPEKGEVLHGIQEASTRLDSRFDAMTIGSKRVLVIEGDAEACARQRKIVEDNLAAASERDLVLVELRGSVVIQHAGRLGLEVPGEFLRRRARLDRLPFQAVLLDLDGDDTHRAFAPIAWKELFGLIDREPVERKKR